ncbi:MAG: hypothetical protein HYZ34_12275, partial [Ignavibacteriae bacterium]|nr:hypothetical protein [Ignavibacteriota bacterium]
GDSISNIDFGNYKYGIISGQKFEEWNGDSLFTGSDYKRGGWVIKLFDSASCQPRGRIVTSSVTGYIFSNLLPGTYIVEESLQTGWVQVVPRVTAPGFSWRTCGSNAGQRSYVVVVTSGTNAIGKDFGNTRYCSISGKKYLDALADSLITNDSAMNGWTIKLYRQGCTLVERTVTSGNGDFVFDSLFAGTYIVEESLFTGWYQSFPRQGSGIVSPCGQNAGARAFSFVLHSGESSTGVSFANYQHGSITGKKFNDLNCNRVQDAGEQGLPNWTISLSSPSGSWTQFTNSQGEYSFTELKPDTFSLREIMQGGWIPTLSDSFRFPLLSGEHQTMNFGNFEYGSISGMKFYDENMDSIQNNDELPIHGWQITLLRLEDSMSRSLMTDSLGSFKFDSLKAGRYIVAEKESLDWRATWLQSDTVDITSDTHITGVNFGNVFEESRACEIAEKWNMVSLPVHVQTPIKDSVFPFSQSDAFKFSCAGGYGQENPLEFGTGYWLKFSVDTTLNIVGAVDTMEYIDVCAGWNMIGSLSDTIDTSCIIPEPPVTIESSYFQYQSGYIPSSIIIPCKAYWVKMSQTGRLILRKCD